jgi:hypothetical protein
MHLRDDSPSFHPVHPRIRGIGPRYLHHAKGRGLVLPFLPRLLRGPVGMGGTLALGFYFLLLGSPGAWSQTFTPSTDPTITVEDLVRELLPPELLLVPNSTSLSGEFNLNSGTATNASGLFDGFTTIFGPGPSRGVLLTNGSGFNALPSAPTNPGIGCSNRPPTTDNTSPNCSPSISQQNQVVGSDALYQLLGGTGPITTNASILGFSVTLDPVFAAGALLELPYVFASDEYNENTNRPSNDLLGIFVNDQNIAFANGDSSSIVSVQTLNGVVTPSLFRNNDPFFAVSSSQVPIPPTTPNRGDLVQYDTEYDGLSVELFASTRLFPDEVYEFSIQIADVAFASVDSGVFLTRARLTPLPVPGPLPLVGLAAAFGWSRHIRRKLRS